MELFLTTRIYFNLLVIFTIWADCLFNYKIHSAQTFPCWIQYNHVIVYHATRESYATGQ